MKYEMEILEGGYREDNRREEGNRKTKENYITPQGLNPLAGLLPISIGSNLNTMQASAEATRNNENFCTCHIEITVQTGRIRKPWNDRQLLRINLWHNIA